MTPLIGAIIGGILGLLGLALALVVHTVTVARWTAKLQTLVEIHSTEIGSLRATRHEHNNRISVIEGQLEEHVEGSR